MSFREYGVCPECGHALLPAGHSSGDEYMCLDLRCSICDQYVHRRYSYDDLARGKLEELPRVKI
jgi:hypothetical protein